MNDQSLVNPATGRFENGESAFDDKGDRWLVGAKVGDQAVVVLPEHWEDLEDLEAQPIWSQRKDGATLAWVERYLNRLPAKHREVLEAVYFERVSEAELATRLGISRGRAHHRVVAAQRAFIGAVAEDNPEYAPAPRSGRGRPRRDYRGELEAASAMFESRRRAA